MSGVNNKTLNNPINKIKKNFNVFKWSADISGIDENISKQDKLIREAQNAIIVSLIKETNLEKIRSKYYMMVCFLISY
jgi:hypothetical protein